MTPQDRERLVELGRSPEVITKVEEVLRAWEVEVLYAACSVCGAPRISPEVRKRQYRRKTPPSELFQTTPLGFTDEDGAIVCQACDDARWQ